MQSQLDARRPIDLAKHEEHERLLESEQKSLATRLSGLKDIAVEF